jgi:general secretion pathway protein D
MIRKYLSVLVCLCLVLPPTSLASTRKGNKYLKEAQAAEARGDWNRALELYLQAVDESPSDSGYLIGMRRARFRAGQEHVDQGQKLRSEGKLAEALAEFQQAILTDPASAIAIQELKRTDEMIQRANKTPVRTEDRGLTPAELVRKNEEERIATLAGPPELKPVIRMIPPVKMNNQPPRVLFETVGKLAGISVVFDSQYQPQGRNFNVDLGNSTVEQAFDYLGMLTRTYWKPMTPTAIFVTEDNVTKRRDYEDNVVRVFYLTNATSVQEFQEIATAIRTVAEIRRVFTYNAQKAMVVRGTLDQVALAEKLVRDLDRPKSEVVVDVIVMEANSARTRDLAATIGNLGTSGLTAGLNLPVAFSPRGSSSTGGGTSTPATTSTSNFTLASLGRLSSADFSTSLPSALLQAMLSDNRTKVLNSPQVRASDGMKVTLQIGDRIPYATGSFQPGVGTVGVSPLVSTQFNFAETGVTVDLTPQVHSPQELTLHIEVTVSAVKQYVDLGGLKQPVIGQRKNNADIRLREGEVNILGGLTQTQDSRSISGLPGLVDIPALGSVLFGTNHKELDRGELMIALIPHIVRTPDYSPENLRGIYVGTDQVVKLSYSPTPEEAQPAAAPPAQPGAAQPPVPPAAPQQPPAVPGAVRASFAPATVQVAVSAPVSINLQVENANDAFSATPIRVRWDPSLLRMNDIAPGDLLTRDGGRVTSVKDIRNDSGEATISIVRLPGAPGITGTGAVATLSFVAVGRGQGSVSVTELGLKNSQTQPMNVTLGSVPVTVQ